MQLTINIATAGATTKHASRGNRRGLSAAEWAVLHAMQDLDREGVFPDEGALAGRLPDMRPATIRRTRFLLVGWGLAPSATPPPEERRGGPRVEAGDDPWSHREPTDAELVAIDDAKTRVRVAAALDEMERRSGAFDDVAGKAAKSPEKVRAGKSGSDVLAIVRGAEWGRMTDRDAARRLVDLYDAVGA